MSLLKDKTVIGQHGFDLLSVLARKFGISRISAIGRYGLISSSPDDAMIFPHYARLGVWDAVLNDLIASFFRDGRGSYLDVGANIGLTLIPLARQYPSVACHAFEPEPANYANLAVNVAENCAAANITLHRIALHDREGPMPFEIATRNLGDHRLHVATDFPARQGEGERRLIDVPCRRLDDMALDLRPPLLAKLDAQGAEPFVIEGGRRTLADADAMIIEWSPYHMARLGADPEVLLAFITENFQWGVIYDSEDSKLFRKGPIKGVTKWLRQETTAWAETTQQVDMLVSKTFPE